MFETFYEKTVTGSWGNPVFVKNGGDDGSGLIMQSEGMLLYGFVRALRPETILEIGTGHGGALLWLAQACRDNQFGIVHTVEIKPEVQQDAINNIEQAGLKKLVRFYKTIPELPQIDFVFLDAGHEAKDMIEYLETIKPKLNNNTIILCHDATWHRNVEISARECGFDYLIMPNTSFCGMAILWKVNYEN